MSEKQTQAKKGFMSKVVAGSAVVIVGTSAFAGTLTENVAFDTGDLTYIFGGMVAAGVTLYGIRKAKSLLGA